MLTFDHCAPKVGRRSFLRAGSLGLGSLGLGAGLGSLSLADLFQAQAQAATIGNGSRAKRPKFSGLDGIVKDKAIVFLHMQGGPSQFETFDPKMSAPSEIRSATGEIATRIPGVTFGSTFTRLAGMADKLTIVRSFVPGNANHDVKPVVSAATRDASLGALYARVAGTTRTETGLPTSAWINPSAIDANERKPTLSFGKFNDPGKLGAGYAPFVPGSGGPLQQAMRLSMAPHRLHDRRELLAQLDSIKRRIDADGGLAGMDRFQEQAFEVILKGAADAFDLKNEDPRVIDRYDTASLVTPSQISKKWNNYKEYVTHGKSLGKLMLMARRLVENGVGFVTVSTDFVWDNHADSNNAGVAEGMTYCGLPFDHAVGTFLDDLAARGLSDKVLLICCGEIGRSPRINKNGGRDHWGTLGPLMMAGGGLPQGKVIGQSARDGGTPQGDPVTQENLIGTIFNTVFDVGRLRLLPGMSTDLLRIAESQPIAGLS